MEQNNPFIKVVWEDVPENFTPEKIKRVKSYFQKKYNGNTVQVITKTLSQNDNTKLKSLEVSDNILDNQYQKTLMKDFIKENSIDVKWELVDRLDNRVNGEIEKENENKVRYNKWHVKKVSFSNFLSFGDNNVIDFTELDGISVVESTPKNFGGKSTSTVDLLMFLFFNSTTKTKTNAEIFNRFTDKDEVLVKGEIVIDDSEYIIERTITRKKTKSGDYTVSNKLEFQKKKPDGTFENLSGEQRRETESFIESAIGSEEDFLSTILTTGYNLEQLIESKPTARGQILTKFMGLESLKEKEEVAKGIYNDWSKKLVSNTYNKVDLQIDIDNQINNIDNSKNELVRLSIELGDLNKNLKTLEERRDHILINRNNNIDTELIKTNPVQLLNEINELKDKQKVSKKLAEDVDVKEPSKYYSEDEHEIIKKEINGLLFDDKVDSDTIVRNEKLLKQFEEGSICPTCNRPLENVDHTEEINKIKELIESLKVNRESRKIKQQELEEKDKSFRSLKDEFDKYERNKLVKARYELDVDSKQVEINTKQLKLDNYESNKNKLEENQKIDTELVALRTKIETTNANIRLNTTTTERENNNIKNAEEKIKSNKELIEKIKSEEELMSIFKIYLSIYGKNGISKIIMKNMIPLINTELSRLLTDSCYFVLELSINDKNEVEFIMIDTETRVIKPLTAGSGYERTISSLALRSVLTKISSLPKPNVVVMDEVFGKIADENLEMVGEFFKKIKNYFDHIIVISHNPLIRNWSDNLIMIKKDENVSSIDYITTKI